MIGLNMQNFLACVMIDSCPSIKELQFKQDNGETLH